jgi:catechol-2,3-dioxygenase
MSLRLFRLNIEVGALEPAAAFYSELLGQETRPQAGGRVYLSAGGVTLQILETSAPHAAAKALYFATSDLDALHARAARLGCLSQEQVHGAPAGQPAVRPWGERSFYAEDPWGNPLCFVEEGTIYAG